LLRIKPVSLSDNHSTVMFCQYRVGIGVTGIKVKLSLSLNKHHAMKTYWGVEVQIHAFLTSALSGNGWSPSQLS